MYTAGGVENILKQPSSWPKKTLNHPRPHPVFTRKVKCGQYDDDNGTEITDLIITLQAFKVGNG